MTCPHALPVRGQPALMTCALIPGRKFTAEPHPAALCPRCRPQWTDGQPPTAAALPAVLRQYDPAPPSRPPAPPTLAQQLAHFRIALARWRAAGFPIASWPTLRRRRSLCRACPYWSGLACQHPGCGCSGLKWAVATEQCPLGKW